MNDNCPYLQSFGICKIMLYVRNNEISLQAIKRWGLVKYGLKMYRK